MWEKLEKVLDKFEEENQTPYYRQGSLVDTDNIPKTFLTFWNTTTPEGSFYDDKANSASWTWTVYFYTTDPSLIYSLPSQFLELAKTEGFIPQGKANDIPSGIEGYVGRFLQLKYFEKYEN